MIDAFTKHEIVQMPAKTATSVVKAYGEGMLDCYSAQVAGNSIINSWKIYNIKDIVLIITQI